MPHSPDEACGDQAVAANLHLARTDAARGSDLKNTDWRRHFRASAVFPSEPLEIVKHDFIGGVQSGAARRTGRGFAPSFLLSRSRARLLLVMRARVLSPTCARYLYYCG